MTQATASNAPIGRFPIPDLHGLPEDIRGRILAVQEKSGFIPNVFLVFARRPDEFRAFGVPYANRVSMTEEGIEGIGEAWGPPGVSRDQTACAPLTCPLRP